MTLPASGSISMAQIQAEFGGPIPIVLSNYYKGGQYVPNTPSNVNVPTSGAISLQSFYGASAVSNTISFVARSSGQTALLNVVRYLSNLWVLGGQGSALSTSPDGITWTPRNPGATASVVNGLGYAFSKYFTTGLSTTSGKGYLSSSTDGVTFTTITTSVNNAVGGALGIGQTLAPFLGKLFFGSFVGNIDGSAFVGGIAYSSDGTVWSLTGGSTSLIQDYKSNGSLLIAFGQASLSPPNSNKSYYLSTMDSTFNTTSQGFISSDGSVPCMTYGNGLWVAGNSIGSIYTSTDGANWVEHFSPFGSFNKIRGIAYGNGKFVCVGNGGICSVSLNGTTWTPLITTPAGTKDITSIDFGNGIFTAVGATGLVMTGS